MGALMRGLDWSTTPLGPPDQWSASLRMMVSLLLANRFPLILGWGPQYIQIYNDAYRPILGTKHPRALGQPVSACFLTGCEYLCARHVFLRKVVWLQEAPGDAAQGRRPG